MTECRVRLPAVCLLILGVLAASAAPAAPAAPRPVLENVVLVARHGVRAPSKPPAELSAYSREPWHAWPVGPSELTEHGADAAAAMGGYLRSVYAAEGLMSADVCRDAKSGFVWADGADSRTRQSGDAMAAGLYGRCAAPAAHGGVAKVDPLFSPDDAGLCPLKAEAARRSILALLPSHDANRLGPDYARALSAMRETVYPGLDARACSAKAHKACVFVDGRNAFSGEGWDFDLKGPLHDGASLSENLLLEYAQGFPAATVGWGRAGSEEKIAALLPLHNLYAALTRKNPYFAGRKGALLAREIAALLSGTRPDFPGAVAVPADARLTLFLGHDTNLSNLAGIYGLDWSLPGQPDVTAPDTVLAFELWRDGSRRFVRVRLHYQTLAELRQSGRAGRGKSLSLAIPGCGDASRGCPIKGFSQLTRAHTESSCFAPSLPQ